MTLPDQLVEIFHGSECRVDRLVVGYIVAVVFPWRCVKRREPYGRRSEFFYIVELRNDAAYVAHSVVVRVHEAERIYLIDNRFFIPIGLSSHICLL